MTAFFSIPGKSGTNSFDRHLPAHRSTAVVFSSYGIGARPVLEGNQGRDVLRSVLINDNSRQSGNWVSGNRLTGNSMGQNLPAIVLQGTSAAKVRDNVIVPASGTLH